MIPRFIPKLLWEPKLPWEASIPFQNEIAGGGNDLCAEPQLLGNSGAAGPTFRHLKPTVWLPAAFMLAEGTCILIALIVTLNAMRGTPHIGVATWSLLLGLPMANAVFLLKRELYAANHLLFSSIRPLRLAGCWIEAFGTGVLLSAIIRCAEPMRLQHDITFFAPELAALFSTGLGTMLALRLGWAVTRSRIAAKARPRVLFLGMLDASGSRQLIDQLHQDPSIRLVSSIDYEAFSGDFGDCAQDGSPSRVHASPRLAALLRHEEIDAIVVASSQAQDDQIAVINTTARFCGIRTLAVLGTSLRHDLAPAITTLGRISVIRADHPPLSGIAQTQKRSMDLILGMIILVLMAPVMGIIALLVRLDSPGPILFRQVRVGRGGALFEILKFRTMRDAPATAGADGPDAAGVELQTTRGDQRITAVGGFLRRHSLDELPQIFNVLRGDMSIIGPRPHAAAMTVNGIVPEVLVPNYMDRFYMRPGITGWAQINGRRGIIDCAETLQKRVDHDLFYIENWSLALDIMILVRTVICLIHDQQAF